MQQTIDVTTLINAITGCIGNKKSINLDIGMNIYLNHVKQDNREGTYKQYRDTLKVIMDFMKELNVYETKDLNGFHIQKFIEYSSNIKKNKAVTINKRIRALKTMLNYLEYMELIDKPVLKYIAPKNVKPVIPRIDKDRLEDLLSYARTLSNKSHLILLLLIGTGIRTNELLHIEFKNIDFKNKRIKLTFTKNSIPRDIYLDNEMIFLIQEIKQSSKSDWLFSNEKTNSPMLPSAVRSVIARTKKTLNIEILSAHKFRHLYATILFENGVPLTIIQKLLGHQSLEMTRIYLDIEDSSVQLHNDMYNPLAKFRETNQSDSRTTTQSLCRLKTL